MKINPPDEEQQFLRHFLFNSFEMETLYVIPAIDNQTGQQVSVICDVEFEDEETGEMNSFVPLGVLLTKADDPFDRYTFPFSDGVETEDIVFDDECDEDEELEEYNDVKFSVDEEEKSGVGRSTTKLLAIFISVSILFVVVYTILSRLGVL